MQYNLIKVGDSYRFTNFMNSDDEKRWKYQKKLNSDNWKYKNLKKNPIYFKTNSMGYRSHEFEFDTDDQYILALGCSYTYGLYLHEEERYSNIIENTTGIKTYNLGICGGSANSIFMNLSKLLYSSCKKPVAVIIQWPEYLRINLPITEPDNSIFIIRASTIYKKQQNIFEELYKKGNAMEYHSLWAKDTTNNLLNTFNIKTIQFANYKWNADLYNVPLISKGDTAYDGLHIGTFTNKRIADYILEKL